MVSIKLFQALLCVCIQVAFVHGQKICPSKTTNMGPSCGYKDGVENSVLTLTDAQKQQILDYHNEVRERIASGQETRLKFKTTANGLYKLKWSDCLQESAEWLVATCQFKHTKKECRNRVLGSSGENLASWSYSNVNKQLDLDSLMDRWVEGEVNITTQSVLAKYEGGDWGHYTQMIWADTQYVGCGVSQYGEREMKKFYLACQYGPSGNYLNTRAFETDGPKCPPGTKNVKNLCESDDPMTPKCERAGEKVNTGGGNTGGWTGGNTGGWTGGNTGGWTGNTGGWSGGNTGGWTGNTGGWSGGNTGGWSGGNTGGWTGNTGGWSGGNTGGWTENTGGWSGGNTGGWTRGNTGRGTGGNTGGWTRANTGGWTGNTGGWTGGSTGGGGGGNRVIRRVWSTSGGNGGGRRSYSWTSY